MNWFYLVTVYGSRFTLLSRGRAGRGAEAVEGLGQLLRDLLGEAVLDLMAFEHEDELAVFEEADLGRGGWVGREVLARLGRGLDVGAREDGDGAVGARGVLQRHRDAGARLARGAAADGVDDDEQRALRVLDGLFHLLRAPRLFDADTRQVFAHRLDKNVRVRHVRF